MGVHPRVSGDISGPDSRIRHHVLFWSKFRSAVPEHFIYLRLTPHTVISLFPFVTTPPCDFSTMSDAPEPTQQSAASAQKALPPIPAPAPGTSRGSSKHSSNGSDNRSVHTDLPHPPSSGSIQAGVQAPMPMPALTSGDPQVGGQAGLPADAPQPTRQSVSSSKNSLPATPISQPTASGSEQASGVQASIPIPAPEPGHPGAIGQPPASGSGQAGVQAPISIPAPEPGHPLEGEGDVPELSTPQVGGGGGVSASQPGNLRGQDNVPPENSQQGGAQGGAAGDAQANVQARLTGQRAFTSGRICLKNGWKACYLLSAMIFG